MRIHTTVDLLEMQEQGTTSATELEWDNLRISNLASFSVF